MIPDASPSSSSIYDRGEVLLHFREEVSGNKRVLGALTMRGRTRHYHPGSSPGFLMPVAGRCPHTQFDTGGPDVTWCSRDGGGLST
jgi:hypothetical protein